MYSISANQIKAARALLDWSQGKLAEAAGVSLTTIRSMENGFAPRVSTMNDIRYALERAGIEFMDNEGVSRHPDEIKVYKGQDSCDRFFHDMLNVVKEQGGDVSIILNSYGIMSHSCGFPDRNNFERMESVQEIAEIKCILPDAVLSAHFGPRFQFRTLPKHVIGPASCFVYGNRKADIVLDSRMHFTFIVFNLASMFHDYQNHFQSLWKNALPPRFSSDGVADQKVRA